MDQELNLYTENFSAMATQAAVMAGFTTTCMVELNIPAETNFYARHALYFCAIVSICANISCVSLSTITTIWGSGMALRGRDGSMDEAVDGISKERTLIFNTFALGLAGNLCTVCMTCFVIMKMPYCFIAIGIVLYTAWLIYSNAVRIQNKFQVVGTVVLDDLTSFHAMNLHRDSDTNPLLGNHNNISNNNINNDANNAAYNKSIQNVYSTRHNNNNIMNSNPMHTLNAGNNNGLLGNNRSSSTPAMALNNNNDYEYGRYRHNNKLQEV